MCCIHCIFGGRGYGASTHYRLYRAIVTFESGSPVHNKHTGVALSLSPLRQAGVTECFVVVCLLKQTLGCSNVNVKICFLKHIMVRRYVLLASFEQRRHFLAYKSKCSPMPRHCFLKKRIFSPVKNQLSGGLASSESNAQPEICFTLTKAADVALILRIFFKLRFVVCFSIGGHGLYERVGIEVAALYWILQDHIRTRRHL